ncbi:DUF192 domain-containing protein [Caenispirillum salinarum]|uniref:DUF192 domain-containing protein n=1 Tax=Caenispirillum salinarum TaxID=859058 RepID=UPI00384BBBED
MTRSRLSRALAAVLVVAAGLLPAACSQAAEPQALPTEPVVVETRDGTVTFTTEIADDHGERAIGLMYRDHLPRDRAMLFQYERPSQIRMWMRNTLIPLDMLFMDRRGEIVHIEREARPHDETPRGPDGLAVGVLEIGGGLAREMGIEKGMTVRHPFFDNGQGG